LLPLSPFTWERVATEGCLGVRGKRLAPLVITHVWG
jgi:hypothetical protein